MKQKDIYLVSFPFSNLHGRKVRPALIVSNDSFNKKSRDVIMCGITGAESQSGNKISSFDLVDGTLHKTCYVKSDSIVKLQKNLLQKRLGSISETLAREVKKSIINLF